mmetsp:Transcript_21620/g.59967  ORF Transcript_21620/g.59967 Transcript_21620/m.59967 type:complete len:261 (-) Transcript_21620:306-1088(-)
MTQTFAHLVRQLQVAVDGVGRLLTELQGLEEGNDLLLPKDALVFLAQVGEGVGGLGVPYIGEASLASQAKMVTDDLGAPASPHVVISPNGLALPHEPKVHGRANGFTVKGQVHTTHGIQGTLWHSHDCIHVALILLTRLDHLRRGIVVRDVHPQTMRHSSGDTLSQAEGVTAHKVCTLAEGIIQGVEEEGRGGGEQVMDVLLQHVDVFAGGLLAHEAVIVDGVNVALLGHHEPEAAAGGVAEGDGRGVLAQDALDVHPRV